MTTSIEIVTIDFLEMMHEQVTTVKQSNQIAPFGAAIMVIGIAIFAAYGNSLTGSFLFDDYLAIVDNISIRSLTPLQKALWAPQDAPTAGRPVVNLSFAVNYAISQFNVFGYHLTNVALHWVNAMLLFALTYQTLARSRWGDSWPRNASSFSFVVALLWSLHPLQTEAVTYITQRTELLMAFFLLCTLYTARLAWDTDSQFNRWGWQLASVLSCGLGMASKEVMVVAPVVVMLYDAAMYDKPVSELLSRRRTLYLGLIGTWGILIALMSTNPRGLSVGFGHSMTSTEYLRVQFWGIAQYLKLSIWPNPLCGDYGMFKMTDPSEWLPGFALVLFLSVLTVFAWFRWRPLSFLGLAFFIILSPTSSFVPIYTEPVAERRMYLPLATLILLVVSAVFSCVGQLVSRKSDRSPMFGWCLRGLLAMATLCVCLIYCWSTRDRNNVYQSELVYWSDAALKRPGNTRAFTNLGYMQQVDKRPDLAILSFQKAIELDPSNVDATSLFGKWHSEQGDTATAMNYYDRAISLNPNRAEVRFLRGLELFKQRRFDESIEEYREAIRINPKMFKAYNNLANALSVQQRLDEAIEIYKAALQLDPSSSSTCTNLGNMLVRKGNYADACVWLERAIKLDASLSDSHFLLGSCYDAIGKVDEAIASFRRSVSLQPKDVSAWFSLGKAYAKQRRLDEARQCFEEAQQLEPNADDIKLELQQLRKD